MMRDKRMSWGATKLKGGSFFLAQDVDQVKLREVSF